MEKLKSDPPKPSRLPTRPAFCKVDFSSSPKGSPFVGPDLSAAAKPYLAMSLYLDLIFWIHENKRKINVREKIVHMTQVENNHVVS